VFTTTIDHYWKTSGASPDLMKIDIEGAEALAVPQMMDLVASQSPEIILEVHPPQVNEYGTTPRQMVNQLREVGGYTAFEIESYRDDHVRATDALVPLSSKPLDQTSPVVIFFTNDDEMVREVGRS
jgi:hypothetical protein